MKENPRVKARAAMALMFPGVPIKSLSLSEGVVAKAQLALTTAITTILILEENIFITLGLFKLGLIHDNRIMELSGINGTQGIIIINDPMKEEVEGLVSMPEVVASTTLEASSQVARKPSLE